MGADLLAKIGAKLRSQEGVASHWHPSACEDKRVEVHQSLRRVRGVEVGPADGAGDGGTHSDLSPS